jgi:hypothetical protein
MGLNLTLRVGDSAQWAQFAERSASRTREQWRSLSAAMSASQLDLGDALDRGAESDPGFSAHYDGIRVGLASWFRQSIDACARAHGIDPETATWK